MDLSQYKMVRSKKFPLPKQSSQKKQEKPHYIQTIALVSSQQPESFQIHTEDRSIILFNDHEYLKRSFNYVYRLQQEDNLELVQELTAEIKRLCLENYNNLIILNALDLTPIQELIFPWRQYLRHKSQLANQDNNKQQPLSILRQVIASVLQKKKGNSLVTLSIVGVRSDGSLEDQLNYEWIQQSKYIEDLIKIRQKSKLKVKKYKSEIKVFDLNRQQIKEWSQAEQILYHYSQIKEYLQCWKQQLQPGINKKIGEIYEICQVSVDEQLGYIKEVFKRKCLLKFNQFMPESNLCAMKITQLLKQRVQNIPSVCARDFPMDMYLKDCFDKHKNYNYLVLTQIGTNQSLKQQAICLNMDLQIPGPYLYLKNYCDKPQVLQEVKQRARNFNPMTSLERTQVKVASVQGNNMSKLKQKTVKILKQSEQIASKSFFFDTYSSNEKKKSSTISQTYNVQTVLQDRKNTFAPYSQFQKPSTVMEKKL